MDKGNEKEIRKEDDNISKILHLCKRGNFGGVEDLLKEQDKPNKIINKVLKLTLVDSNSDDISIFLISKTTKLKFKRAWDILNTSNNINLLKSIPSNHSGLYCRLLNKDHEIFKQCWEHNVIQIRDSIISRDWSKWCNLRHPYELFDEISLDNLKYLMEELKIDIVPCIFKETSEIIKELDEAKVTCISESECPDPSCEDDMGEPTFECAWVSERNEILTRTPYAIFNHLIELNRYDVFDYLVAHYKKNFLNK